MDKSLSHVRRWGTRKGSEKEPGTAARRPKESRQKDQVTQMLGLYREGQRGKGSPVLRMERFRIWGWCALYEGSVTGRD